MEENKGYLYCMIPVNEDQGIVKIGSTNDFSERMSIIERNGYRNFHLKRYYAIEVNNYTKKEEVLKSVFSFCRLGDTECFAINKDIVVSLMTAFDGKQIYPENQEKENIFEESLENIKTKDLPDSEYTGRKGEHTATLKKKGEELILVKGSYIEPEASDSLIRENGKAYKLWKEIQESMIENNKLKENCPVSSVSQAARVVKATVNNGWTFWKIANTDKTIDSLRPKQEKEDQ